MATKRHPARAKRPAGGAPSGHRAGDLPPQPRKPTARPNPCQSPRNTHSTRSRRTPPQRWPRTKWRCPSRRAFGTPVAVLRPFNTYGPAPVRPRAVIPDDHQPRSPPGQRKMQARRSLTPHARLHVRAATPARGFITGDGLRRLRRREVDQHRLGFRDFHRAILVQAHCRGQWAKTSRSRSCTDEDSHPPRRQSEVERLFARWRQRKRSRLFGWAPEHLVACDGFARRASPKTAEWFQDPQPNLSPLTRQASIQRLSTIPMPDTLSEIHGLLQSILRRGCVAMCSAAPEGFVPLHEPEFLERGGRGAGTRLHSLRLGLLGGLSTSTVSRRSLRSPPAALRTASLWSTAPPRWRWPCASPGVTPGDEVLMPSLTFIATANATHITSARCRIFVDAEARNRWGLDPVGAARASGRCRGDVATVMDGPQTARTGRRLAAVVPMHVFGHPVDMDGLAEVATRLRPRAGRGCGGIAGQPGWKAGVPAAAWPASRR